MTHPGHNITHCVHGTIVSQCRCAIKDKPSVVVECPKNCDARRVHLAGSDEVVERVENQLYAMRNDGWDLRPFIALAAEVRALRARVAKRERQLLCAYIGDLQFDDGEILYHHTFGHPPRRTLMDVHCTDAEILAEIDAAMSARSGEDGA